MDPEDLKQQLGDRILHNETLSVVQRAPMMGGPDLNVLDTFLVQMPAAFKPEAPGLEESPLPVALKSDFAGPK